MRKLLALLVLAYFTTLNVLAATSNPGFTQYAAIPATNTTITFHTYAKVIQIWSDPSAADLYVNYQGGAATVGGSNCIHIPGGAGWQSPTSANLGCTSIQVIGASATGKYTVTAQ
jgi:hypothetical protein